MPPEQIALRHLLTAANYLSPNSDAQKGFSRIVQQATEDGSTVRETCLYVVMAIKDGLHSNFWPGQ